MNPGELKHKITIQQDIPLEDASYNKKENWVNVAGLIDLRASITTTGGREFYAAQRVNAETSTLITIRYKPGISPKMRVKYGTRYFDILNVNDVNEAHIYILLSCKEVI